MAKRRSLAKQPEAIGPRKAALRET